MEYLKGIFFVWLMLLPLGGLRAQALDSFNPVAGTVRTLVVQPDGKVLIGGLSSSVGSQQRNRIARVNADGTLDPDFNPNVTGSSVQALAVQADGKVLVGGFFNAIGGQARTNIGRLHPDGSLDSGFDPGANSSVMCFAFQEDGKILVGGDFTLFAGQARIGIARLNADGSLDAGFNPILDAGVRTIAVQPDGKILIGGAFISVNGQQRNRIARLNADGTTDSGSLLSANGVVQAIALQADGKILMAGDFFIVSSQTRVGIARLNADGSLDSGFNANVGGTTPGVRTIALQADGKICIGGYFATVGGQTRNQIARLNPNGSLENDFQPVTYGGVHSLSLQADGKIIAGGGFFSMDDVGRSGAARFNNSPATQTLTVTGTSQIDWQRAGSAPELGQVSFEIWNGSAWVGQGNATRVSGGWRMEGLSLPASTWVRARGMVNCGQNNGSIGLIDQIVAYGDGDLPDIAVAEGGGPSLVSGQGGVDFGTVKWLTSAPQRTLTITNVGDAPLLGLGTSLSGKQATEFSIGALATTSLAPGASTTLTVGHAPLGSGPRRAKLSISSNDGDEASFEISLQGLGDQVELSFIPLPNSVVRSLVTLSDGKILIGGGFNAVGGQFRDQIARLQADGSLDSSFNPGTNSQVWGMAAQLNGKVIVVGTFTTLGGQSRNGIARLNADGSFDTGFNPASGGAILALALQADGKILVGGSFATMGGQARNGIARLNEDGSLDTGFNPNSGGSVSALAIQADGKILVGGSFTTFGGQARNRIARLNADGSLDTGFNPGANNSVSTIAVQPDGKILVGGSFAFMGGQERGRLARLNADGSLDSDFDASGSHASEVSSFALQADGKILVGGTFISLGPERRSRVGRLNADGSVDADFNLEIAGVASSGVRVSAIALQSNGEILLGGIFTSISGKPRTYMAKLENYPAAQVLTVTGTGQMDWQRGGSAPEVEQVIFEILDGSTWVSQGAAERVAGGWRKTGMTLPASGTVRARGRSTGSEKNASSILIEQTVSYGGGGPGGTLLEAINSATAAAGLSGDDALPDAIPFNDGVENLLKYAFNMDLSGPDTSSLAPGTGTAGLPFVGLDGSGETAMIRVEFLRRKGSGLIYTPKKSSSLDPDSFVPIGGTQVVTSIDENWERVVIEESADPEILPRSFAIVEVSLP